MHDVQLLPRVVGAGVVVTIGAGVVVTVGAAMFPVNTASGANMNRYRIVSRFTNVLV